MILNLDLTNTELEWTVDSRKSRVGCSRGNQRANGQRKNPLPTLPDVY